MRLTEKYFDTAFTAPDGAKKIRDLVLTLAIQGKLIPQDPDDPPASQLIKAIDTQKKQLIKTRKIKTLLPLQDINVEQMPFDLPGTWQWVRLGDIGNIFNGNSINAHEKSRKYSDRNGLPYLSTKDVGYGLDALEYETGVFVPDGEKKFRVAHKGAVLICAEGGSAGKKCGITNKDICFGNKLFANELFGGIPSRFILYFYLTPLFRSFFESSMTGIIGGVSIAKFTELLIPLPPLNEQRRIVEKIDRLLAHCDEFERLREERELVRVSINTAALRKLMEADKGAKFDSARKFLSEHFSELYSAKQNVVELRSAVLELAIRGRLVRQDLADESAERLFARVNARRNGNSRIDTDGFSGETAKFKHSIPSNWRWSSLGDLLVFGPTNGLSPKAVDYKTSVRSLTLSATTSGVFKGEHSKFIDLDIPSESDLWLRDGEILVQRGNTLEYVGVPAIYRGESHAFIYPDLMMKLRVSPEIDTNYIYYAMSADSRRKFLRDHASGTSGTMPKINHATLRALPIPLPPINEQKRIVGKIVRLLELCDSLATQIDGHTAVKTNLLSAAIAKV